MPSVYCSSMNMPSAVTLGSYTTTLAPSSSRFLATYAAAVSRVSPVSFLKAKPSMAMRLPVTELNMRPTTFLAKRSFW